MREFKKQDIFQQSPTQSQENHEKNLFNFLIDLFTKSNQLLNIINQDEIDDVRAYKKKKATVSGDELLKLNKDTPEHVQRNDPLVDKLKYIEMQLNKKGMLLDKAKVICLKLDKIFMILPFTISKIEIRMRNIILSNKQILDGISHFMNFYLVT